MGTFLVNMGLVRVYVLQSMRASKARINELLSKNGVRPGTIATFSINFPIGMTSACSEVSVP